jgi:phosphatidylinositol N-acetylglucosaminyltransferase subunit C
MPFLLPYLYCSAYPFLYIDPDNYTDPETFLDHLQRNPRLRPYDFWPLVADSTVIVQHVCSVAIFICAYAAIYQDRISPIAIVSCGSLATVIGWILWDYWMATAEQQHEPGLVKAEGGMSPDNMDDGSSTSSVGSSNPIVMNGHISSKPASTRGLGLTLSTTNLTGSKDGRKTPNSSRHSASFSKSSAQSISPIESLHPSGSEPFPNLQPTAYRQSRVYYAPTKFSPSVSLRVQARLKTFKSAILIYFALLGLSPILKSLTKSTSSDSIWALATWLLIINIFFFDYGGLYIPSKSRSTIVSSKDSNLPSNSTLAPINDAVRAPPFPSSLSTNAALMASTVLASRLTSTTHVFSLTLFSIEVFGLFPVFRRHLRHESWTGHVLLTAVLIAMSSGGVGLILSKSYTHTYGTCGFCWGWIWHVVSRSLFGLIIGSLGTAFVMGGCSWWLIGLQRYKNVVTGPWDPARPILAGGTHRGRGATE